MPARVPILWKTPFAIDPEPLTGSCSSRAGLSGVSRVYRSLGLPGSCAANLGALKNRQRGLESGQNIESLVVLHAAGGECMDDMDRLREDEGLVRILGYDLPSSRAVKDFIERFHNDDNISKAQAQATDQQKLAFIPEPTPALVALGSVLTTSARQAGKAMGAQSFGTVDLDGTIIPSEKKAAKWTYKGMKGYQPLVAMWAEMGLVLG